MKITLLDALGAAAPAPRAAAASAGARSGALAATAGKAEGKSVRADFTAILRSLTGHPVKMAEGMKATGAATKDVAATGERDADGEGGAKESPEGGSSSGTGQSTDEAAARIGDEEGEWAFEEGAPAWEHGEEALTAEGENATATSETWLETETGESAALAISQAGRPDPGGTLREHQPKRAEVAPANRRGEANDHSRATDISGKPAQVRDTNQVMTGPGRASERDGAVSGRTVGRTEGVGAGGEDLTSRGAEATSARDLPAGKQIVGDPVNGGAVSGDELRSRTVGAGSQNNARGRGPDSGELAEPGSRQGRTGENAASTVAPGPQGDSPARRTQSGNKAEKHALESMVTGRKITGGRETHAARGTEAAGAESPGRSAGKQVSASLVQTAMGQPHAAAFSKEMAESRSERGATAVAMTPARATGEAVSEVNPYRPLLAAGLAAGPDGRRGGWQHPRDGREARIDPGLAPRGATPVPGAMTGTAPASALGFGAGTMASARAGIAGMTGGAMPGQWSRAEPSDPLLGDADALAELGGSDLRSPTATDAKWATAPRDMPAATTRQVVEAALRARDRGVEIALDPPELGRVRMHLVTHDQQLVLQISAERPETLEMMRRHIHDLGQTFRALGYSDVGFAFGERGGDPQSSARGPAFPVSDAGPVAEDLAEQAPRTPPALSGRAGLDLRL